MTTNTDTTPHWFGLHGPEDAPAVWGARTITNVTGLIDLVHDRQSYRGDEGAQLALRTLLGCGVFETVQANYQDALDNGRMHTRKSARVRLYEDAQCIVESDCRGSAGYLYLVAWLKPCELGLGLANLRFDDSAPGDGLIWSCTEAPPALGEIVYLTSHSWLSVDGRGLVVGYGAEHGHVFVIVHMYEPTERYLVQHGRNALCNFMGREWARPRTEPHGWCEVADAAELAKLKSVEGRETRRNAMQTFRKGRHARHRHVTEVYMVLLPRDARDGVHAVLINRTYGVIRRVPHDEAKALMERAVVLNTWEGYTHHGRTGNAVWLAYPGSADAEDPERALPAWL